MDKAKITIYFVRHALTGSNEKLTNGHAYEDGLTELGKIQTNLLGMSLSCVKFDKAFSSDYTRAIQTAKGILKQSAMSPDCPIEISEQLREVNLGIFENRPYKEIMDYCKNLKETVHHWSFPDGESFPEAGQRFLQFVENICDQHFDSDGVIPTTTILIVSHSAVLTCFVTALLENNNHELLGFDRENRKIMNNACYMKVEVSLKLEPCGIDDSVSRPKNFFQFNVLETYHSAHLNCLKGCETQFSGINPILDFAKKNKAGQRFANCVQQ